MDWGVHVWLPIFRFVDISSSTSSQLSDPASICYACRASSTVPGLQKGEQPLLEDVENSGEEQGQSQEDEQLVRELPAVVLGDEFPPELDGPRHAPEFFIGLVDRPWGGRFKQQRQQSEHETFSSLLVKDFNYTAFAPKRQIDFLELVCCQFHPWTSLFHQ